MSQYLSTLPVHTSATKIGTFWGDIVYLSAAYLTAVSLLLLLLPGAELPLVESFGPSQRPLSITLDPGRTLSSF